MILNIKRLAEVKMQKDIDTRYLAKAAAIKFPVLIKIENGEIKPTDKTIQRIATALGVGVDCIAESKDVVQKIQEKLLLLMPLWIKNRNSIK